MSTMIMDLCSYTRLGLTGYLTSRGIKKQEIVEVNNAADLQKHCTSCCPAVVFLNEDCFVHDDESNGIIRQIITQNPATLFVIFMSLANIHFDRYLRVRKNLLIKYAANVDGRAWYFANLNANEHKSEDGIVA